MKSWVLFMYISSGFGSSATGGSEIIDGFTSQKKCVYAQHQFASRLGSKLDDSYCIEIEK